MTELENAQTRVSSFIRENPSIRIAVAVVPREGDPFFATSQDVHTDIPLPICSTTKIVTAMAICRLAEIGVLALDKPVEHFLPELPEFARQATLEHLLSHRAGFSDADGEAAPEAGDRESYVKAALERRRPVAKPGRVFWYSNLGFDLAAIIAERVTGASFFDLVRERVLEPLGMSQSRFDEGFEAASGGLLCSIRDAGILTRALLRGDRSKDMTAIRGDAVTEPFRYYGLGIGIEYWRGRRLLQHGGYRPGYGSYLHLAPAEGCGMVSLFEPPIGFGLHPYSVLDSLLPGEGTEDPPEDPPIASLVGGEFEGRGGSRIHVRFLPNRMITSCNGKETELKQSLNRIYRSEDGQIHAGLVAGARGEMDPAFVMWNEDPIGFVSATPYRRVSAGS